MLNLFINPYNFIPLGKEEDYQTKERGKTLQGVIEYSLLTKTPLFIPNTSTSYAFSEPPHKGKEEEEEGKEKEKEEEEEKEGHKSYDFYSYANLEGHENACHDIPQEPVIPGSSIRGLIRSAYEILTNSCLSVLEEDDSLLTSKRTAEVYRAGLLKWDRGNLVLYEATDCLMRTEGANSLRDDPSPLWAKGSTDTGRWARECYVQKSLQEGQQVWFEWKERGYRIKPIALSVQPEKGGSSQTEGYVIKGMRGPDMNGAVGQKHSCHIFSPMKMGRNDKLLRCPSVKILSAEELETLDDVLRIYGVNAKGAYAEYKKNYQAFKEGKREGTVFPVYYSTLAENYVTLSPAAITREIYKNGIKQLAGKHIQCADKEKLCPACQLFGMLNTTKGLSRASLVRFTDLHLSMTEDEKARQREEKWSGVYEGILTIPEMSNPKLSNMEFYLQRPDESAVFWTYDYYIDEACQLHKVDVPVMNGRKFFWHNMDMKLEDLVEEQGERNKTIRPLKRNVVFRGKVFFEGITEEELQTLLYTLSAGDGDALRTKKRGYKLGGGKAFGFGSVSIHVDRLTLRAWTLEGGQVGFEPTVDEEDPAIREPLSIDEKLKESFALMTSFCPEETKGVPITYPRVPGTTDGKEGYEWYTQENHLAYAASRNRDRSLTKSPDKRTQQFFAEYMAPPAPALASTGVLAGMGIQKATVKSFDAVKGFGFVILDEDGSKAFMHKSKMGRREEISRLQENVRLFVKVSQGDRGLQVDWATLM